MDFKSKFYLYLKITKRVTLIPMIITYAIFAPIFYLGGFGVIQPFVILASITIITPVLLTFFDHFFLDM